MSDSGGSKANLARIRDNQRRSRARRKEYLQELETKYRACEQRGVEASAEMQAAARKVLDENKRLRSLLKARGMSDAEIDAFMAAEGEESSDEPASRKLTTMLQVRKSHCPDSDGTCSPPPSAGSSTQLAVLPDSKPQMQLPPPHLGHGLSTRQLAPLPLGNSSMSSRSPIPMSAAMPTAMAMATTLPSSSAPMQMPPNYHVTLGPHHSGAPSHASPAYSAYPYNTSYETHWQPQPPPLTYDNTNRGRPIQNYGGDGRDAASIIRSMRTDAGQEIDAHLGLGQGTESGVDNIVAYDTMQKYGNQSHGLWR